jgi:hypothetical protein
MLTKIDGHVRADATRPTLLDAHDFHSLETDDAWHPGSVLYQKSLCVLSVLCGLSLH